MVLYQNPKLKNLCKIHNAYFPLTKVQEESAPLKDAFLSGGSRMPCGPSLQLKAKGSNEPIESLPHSPDYNSISFSAQSTSSGPPVGPPSHQLAYPALSKGSTPAGVTYSRTSYLPGGPKLSSLHPLEEVSNGDGEIMGVYVPFAQSDLAQCKQKLEQFQRIQTNL